MENLVLERTIKINSLTGVVHASRLLESRGFKSSGWAFISSLFIETLRSGSMLETRGARIVAITRYYCNLETTPPELSNIYLAIASFGSECLSVSAKAISTP